MKVTGSQIWSVGQSGGPLQGMNPSTRTEGSVGDDTVSDMQPSAIAVESTVRRAIVAFGNPVTP